MQIFNVIVTLSWLTFIVYWFLSSFGVKRTIRPSGVNGPLFRIGLTIFIFIILYIPAVQTFLIRVDRLLAPYFNTATETIGALLCVLGVSLAIWARRHLGRNWGMPMSLKENRELVVSGPYTLIRHPIYTGMLCTLFGTALVNGIFWLVPFVIISIYFIYSARVEEGIMTREFPTEYPLYKVRTKMLIPFIF